jgi:hypothetical protein
MSSDLIFYVLPFDPTLTSEAKIRLPFDLDDFAQRLGENFPDGELRIDKSEGNIHIRLYLQSEEYGTIVVANFVADESTILEISGWPKRMAKELILWYRQHVSQKYPLFLIVSGSGEMIKLTEHTSSEDIEKLYPGTVDRDN